jgi:hypothetical protein
MLSKNNSKLGKMLNLSLVPVRDCGDCSACAQDCYAVKAFRQYPATRALWTANGDLWRADTTAAVNAMYRELQGMTSSARTVVRLFVAGDILSQDMLDGLSDIARAFPLSIFFGFTKMSDRLSFADCPSNLRWIHSQWEGRTVTATDSDRRAWIVGDNRAPQSARVCPATFASAQEKKTARASAKGIITCDRCKFCAVGSGDVLFNLH